MDNEKIGCYLLNKRKEKGLKQKELAEILGVTFQAVSRWEKGDSIPDLDSLHNLADYYEVTIDDILQRKVVKEEEEEFPVIIFGLATLLLYTIGMILFIGLRTIFPYQMMFAYIGYGFFFVNAVFLHQALYFLSNKTKTELIWYGALYGATIVYVALFFFIKNGIIG